MSELSRAEPCVSEAARSPSLHPLPRLRGAAKLFRWEGALCLLEFQEQLTRRGDLQGDEAGRSPDLNRTGRPPAALPRQPPALQAARLLQCQPGVALAVRGAPAQHQVWRKRVSWVQGGHLRESKICAGPAGPVAHRLLTGCASCSARCAYWPGRHRALPRSLAICTPHPYKTPTALFCWGQPTWAAAASPLPLYPQPHGPHSSRTRWLGSQSSWPACRRAAQPPCANSKGAAMAGGLLFQHRRTCKQARSARGTEHNRQVFRHPAHRASNTTWPSPAAAAATAAAPASDVARRAARPHAAACAAGRARCKSAGTPGPARLPPLITPSRQGAAFHMGATCEGRRPALHRCADGGTADPGIQIKSHWPMPRLPLCARSIAVQWARTEFVPCWLPSPRCILSFIESARNRE